MNAMSTTAKKPSNARPVMQHLAATHPSQSDNRLDAASLQKLGTSTALALGRKQAWYDFRSTLPLLVSDILASSVAVTAATLVHRWNGGTPHPAFCISVVLLVV